MLDKAIEFAHKAHAGQYRKKFPIKVPYITHCFDVYKRLLKWRVYDEDILTASLLHDTVEDKRATLEEIELLFGSTVTCFVEELTIFDNENKDDYIKSFKDKTIESLIIKLSDRICNIRDYAITGCDAHKYTQKGKLLFEFFVQRKDELYSALFAQVDIPEMMKDCQKIWK